MNTFQKIVNKRKEDAEMFKAEYQKALGDELRKKAIERVKEVLGDEFEKQSDEDQERVVQLVIRSLENTKQLFKSLEKAKLKADYEYYDMIILNQDNGYESRLYRLIMYLTIDRNYDERDYEHLIANYLVQSIVQENAFEFLNYFYTLLKESYNHYLFNYYWKFVRHCVFNFTFEKKDLYKILDQALELLNVSEYLGKEDYFQQLRKIASINNKTPKTNLKPNQSFINTITKYGFFL